MVQGDSRDRPRIHADGPTAHDPSLGHNRLDLEKELIALRERIDRLESRSSLIESTMHPWSSKTRDVRLYDWEEFVSHVVDDWQGSPGTSEPPPGKAES